MKRAYFALLTGIMLSACATPAPAAEADGFTPAQRVEALPPSDPTLTQPSETERAPPAPHTRGRDPTPAQTLAAANVAARQRPSAERFDGARHVYRYEAGALYELYANPNYISTILLEPGEVLIVIAAGDTARWMVSETIAETQGDGRVIVLVKPQASNLRTNIVLITDKRTYLIEAISRAGEAYAAQIAWIYPRDAAAETPRPSIDQLNLDYRVRTIRGRAPVWSPIRVFDDGRRTWIEFAPQVAAADMPPLFVVTGEGAEIVNYRVRGQRYEVDRLFDVAELRLGVRAPVIVRIERLSALPAAQRPIPPRRRP